MATNTVYYGPVENDNFRSIDLYLASKPDNTRPLIVFIHGGAWRSEDKTDYKDLVLDFKQKGYSTASINYRLSIEECMSIQHPNHILDVGEGIKFLYNYSSDYYDKNRIYLVGHSAGAHIASMLLLDTELNYHQYIQGIIGVSGIYDIPLLIKTFPTYLDFIAQAFEKDTSTYFQASPISKKLNEGLDKPIIIAQSEEDKLINNEQSEVMFQHLKKLGANVTLDMSMKGDHYEVMNSSNLLTLVERLLST